jgi:hypothetical protein
VVVDAVAVVRLGLSVEQAENAHQVVKLVGAAMVDMLPVGAALRIKKVGEDDSSCSSMRGAGSTR